MIGQFCDDQFFVLLSPKRVSLRISQVLELAMDVVDGTKNSLFSVLCTDRFFPVLVELLWLFSFFSPFELVKIFLFCISRTFKWPLMLSRIKS